MPTKWDVFQTSDREGMRVMRSNLDSPKIETLEETVQGDTDRRDATKWCVQGYENRGPNK